MGMDLYQYEQLKKMFSDPSLQSSPVNQQTDDDSDNTSSSPLPVEDRTDEIEKMKQRRLAAIAGQGDNEIQPSPDVQNVQNVQNGQNAQSSPSSDFSKYLVTPDDLQRAQKQKSQNAAWGSLFEGLGEMGGSAGAAYLGRPQAKTDLSSLVKSQNEAAEGPIAQKQLLLKQAIQKPQIESEMRSYSPDSPESKVGQLLIRKIAADNKLDIPEEMISKMSAKDAHEFIINPMEKFAQIQANKDYKEALLGHKSGKEDKDYLHKIQKQYSDDTKKADEGIQQIKQAKDTVQLALKNPIAAKAKGIETARGLMGSGRINIQEINALSGSGAISARAKQAFQSALDGTLTSENAKYFNEFLDAVMKSRVSAKKALGDKVISPYSNNTGKSYEDSYKDVTGKDVEKPVETQDPSVGEFSDPDKEKRYQEWKAKQ